MEQRLIKLTKFCAYPVYIVYKHWRDKYGIRHPMWLADHVFYNNFGRHINWDEPEDLNEKINWLKFHVDPHKWACLADKFAVREYVAKCGLADILVPLYGKWDSAQAVLDAWDSLPEEFVLKSNNGSGNIIIVSEESGGKNSINRQKLKKILESWLAEKDFGLDMAELHYQFIQNCIIAEKLLKDVSIKEFSCSMVDYKIWCFNGEPYGCHLAYDRKVGTSHHYFDYYDLEWNEHTELMSDVSPRHLLPRPKNWERMLEIAAILSKGHPQMRVDLYNQNGKIYFGELTFTSEGGYMGYFSQKLLLEMGKQIRLDLTMPGNEFMNHSK